MATKKRAAKKKPAKKKATKKRAPRKGESKTSPRRVRASVKQIKAMRLRLAGLYYHEIADELKYASPSGAQQAVKRAMALLPLPVAEELREQELRKLDELERSLWPMALKGGPSSVHGIIRCMTRRARMLGTDAAKKIEGKIDIPADALAYREAVLELIHGLPDE